MQVGVEWVLPIGEELVDLLAQFVAILGVLDEEVTEMADSSSCSVRARDYSCRTVLAGVIKYTGLQGTYH